MKTAEGTAVNGADDHWIVECPVCEKSFEYQGFFDPDEITECKCGCRFKTNRVLINDTQFIN